MPVDHGVAHDNDEDGLGPGWSGSSGGWNRWRRCQFARGCTFSLQGFADTKEQVRQAVDLVEVVSEHVTLARAGRGYRGLCPFHKEKTPSFHVIPDKGIFHCFGCKVGGDVFKFVQLREGVSFPEAVRMLADRAGITIDSRRRTGPSGPERTDLARTNAWAADLYRRQLLDPQKGRQVREYLAARMISDQTAERFGLGLAVEANAALLQAARLAGLAPELLEHAGLIRSNDSGGWYDTFRNRLMFPIRDTTRRVIGFGGRTLGEARAKYLNTSQNDLFDKGRVLYGLDLARNAIASSGRAVVVEGYTDCIACHQAGFTETVATLGTAMTEAHIELLRRHCDQIVLLFDSDTAGASAAERALRIALQHGLSVQLAFVPEGKDPCEFVTTAGAEAFAAVLKSATDALVFTWERIRATYDSQESDSGRRRAVREFVALISGLSRLGGVDAIQKGLIANQVAKLLRLRSEQVHHLFAESARAASRRFGSPEQPSGASAPRAAPNSTEQAALTVILEVLLNEPGLYGAAREGCWSPERFEDPVQRRVGTTVRDLAEQLGEFSLLEVLDRLSDPAEAQWATELHLRGERRGNFEATMKGAVAGLAQTAAARRTAELARQLQGADPEGPGSADARSAEHLEAIHKASHEFRHFSPPSKLSAVRETEV